VKQRSKHTASADAPRVDYLLEVLSALSQDDPPPALRGRLELLSSRRLRNGPAPLRLKPVFALALLVAIGITALFTAYLRQPTPLQRKIESRVAPPDALFDRAVSAPVAARSPESTLPATRHPLPKWTRYNTAQRMTVRLPYSDAAIDTGTDATIRVSMSQAELAALGFPINTTLHDRRVLAELTLGDDGLPRAISVSLPLEVVKEKK
jgi:hypothetical protein